MTDTDAGLATEIERLRARLERERRARAEAESVAEAATARLYEAGKRLEEFASVIAHDLQEPLRVVRNFTQLLARRYQGHLGDEADEFIGFITDATERMQAMIAGLLTYSRVTTKGDPLRAVHASDALNGALTNLGAAIEEAGATVTAEPLPTVRGDLAELDRLFQNLIGNAIKYAHGTRPPELRVAARRDGDEWVFEVSDNGKGFEPQYAERVFGLFQRLEKRSETPGTGMGLAIARRIVEHHGGRIWAESEPGVGSTFCFTLQAVGVETGGEDGGSCG